MKKKLLSLVLVIVLLLVNIIPAFAIGETLTSSASPDEIRAAMEIVTDSVTRMKNLFPENTDASVMDIFRSFSSKLSPLTSTLSLVNGSVSFMKLIGIMEDKNAAAMASILEQVREINEKVQDMDRKLNEITVQMSKLQASVDFNARTEKAIMLHSGWKDFEYRYMEDGMDAIITQYNGMMLNGMQRWCLNTSTDARNYGGINNTSVMIPYTLTDGSYEVVFSHGNSLPENDRYLILSEDFLPSSVSWNVNTFRDDIEGYIISRINEAVSEGKFDAFVSDNFPEFTSEGSAALTESLISMVASDAVDQIIYRVSAAEVNKDSTFSLEVSRQFQNYCSHLLGSEEGLDAMFKTMYLTHAFEYQIADDYLDFCAEMAIKTGVYGTFAANVLGMSDFITDSEKTASVDCMCKALNTIGEARQNGLTGSGRYCYLTNTEIVLSEIEFDTHADIYTREDNAVTTYKSSSCDPIKVRFYARWRSGVPNPTRTDLIGDSAATLLVYTLQSNGVTLNYDYFNNNLGEWDVENLGPIITSFGEETTMPLEKNSPMLVTKILGDWFTNGSIIYLNNLPKKATSSYFSSRRMIAGSLLDPVTGNIEINRVLSGLAIYGETHFTWFDDEVVLIGGSASQDSFYKYLVKNEESSIYYYNYDYDQEVWYNCLIRRPVSTSLLTGSRYNPLASFTSLSLELMSPEVSDYPVFTSPVTEQSENAVEFSDVSPDDWFYDDVTWAAENGITLGIGDGLFDPDGICTREQFVTFLWRAAGAPVSDSALPFTDLHDNEEAAAAIRWAYDKEIVKGISDSLFDPDSSVTREQLATFIYRYVKALGCGFSDDWMFLLDYDDAGEISSWANEAMHWCVMNSVVNGYGDRILDPQGTAYRSQVVAMLHRLFSL